MTATVFLRTNFFLPLSEQHSKFPTLSHSGQFNRCWGMGTKGFQRIFEYSNIVQTFFQQTIRKFNSIVRIFTIYSYSVRKVQNLGTFRIFLYTPTKKYILKDTFIKYLVFCKKNSFWPLVCMCKLKVLYYVRFLFESNHRLFEFEIRKVSNSLEAN